MSGLWTSAFALGNFVGPSFAGIIFEQVGNTGCLKNIHRIPALINAMGMNRIMTRTTLYFEKAYIH